MLFKYLLDHYNELIQIRNAIMLFHTREVVFKLKRDGLALEAVATSGLDVSRVTFDFSICDLYNVSYISFKFEYICSQQLHTTFNLHW